MAEKYNLGPVGGLNFTELINSNITGIGDFSLLDNINNYSMIYVEWIYAIGSSNEAITSIFARRQDGTYVKKSEIPGYYIMTYGFGSSNAYVNFSFSDNGMNICIADISGKIVRIVGIN